MATPLQLLQLFILTSSFISTTTVTAIDNASSSSISPSSPFPPSSSSPALLGPILAKLGFLQLADAAAENHSTTAAAELRGPATIFAPADSSLLTCPSCSVPLLLQEHSIAGLYPLHHLRKLAFGTKIETLASSRCITITSDENSSNVFVGGMEITDPDLYNDDRVVIHRLRGFVSHLSPISCNIERMSSLSFPPPPPMAGFYIMRLMLKDAMLRLRISGFSVLALALRVKYSELLDLRALTLFALDDESIFAKGNSYVSDLGLHIVPNRRLMAADLESFPAATVLPTMEWGRSLVVTTAGGGGPFAPMRINYEKVKSFDFVYNLKIAVHVLSSPFRSVNQTAAVELAQINRCEMDGVDLGNAGFCEMVSPTPGMV
ncbi:hypothetical protein CsSME_00046650 [Camellia sinensis var. sinensis]